MRRTVARRRAGDGGFTLVELLVVIVILATLAAIVVFAVAGITNKGTTSSCKADRSSVETAEEAYYAENGSYTDMTGLVNGKFIHEASTLHSVAPASGGYAAGYTVSTSGSCTGVSGG